MKYSRSDAAAAAAAARLVFLPSDLGNEVHLFSTAPKHYFFQSLEDKETNVTLAHLLKRGWGESGSKTLSYDQLACYP